MLIVQIGPFPISGRIISGGVEASIYGLAREQAKSHSVVTIDIPRIGGIDLVEQIEGVTVYRFCNRGTHNRDTVSRIGDIVEIVNALNPTVCHIHGTGLFSWKLYDALSKKKIPIMLTIHGLVREEKLKSLWNRFSLKTIYQLWAQALAECKLLQTASNAIVDTQYVANRINRYRLCSRPKLTVIPQGIDDTFFRMSCSPGSRMILSVGGFSFRKGHLLLIRAFEEIGDSIPDATLVICGFITDKAYYDEVVEYVNKSSFKKRIRILKEITKDQLQGLYEHARIFALHSQEESQGIVFAEAMAVGLPIVATNVGGIPYVVDNGVTGLLTEYGDLEAFASSLRRLLTDEKEWKRMSIEGKATSKHYSWTTIARSIETRYASFV